MQYQSMPTGPAMTAPSSGQDPMIGQPMPAGPGTMTAGTGQAQTGVGASPATGEWRGAPTAGGAAGQTQAAPFQSVAQQPPPGSRDPLLNQPRGIPLPEAAQKVLEELPEYQIQLEPPGPERLFRLESEQTLQERMRQEARQRPTLERINFPEEPVLSTQAYAARPFPPAQELVEPNYVCYRRLYFEDKNSERYGWDLGFIQPFVSAGIFYWDVVTLPYHLGTDPCRKFECSAGYCLPGDGGRDDRRPLRDLPGLIGLVRNVESPTAGSIGRAGRVCLEWAPPRFLDEQQTAALQERKGRLLYFSLPKRDVPLVERRRFELPTS
jgi:hypothetical protein